MIVISAGMPRAGTGWIYNLTNDLLIASGGHDARAVRAAFKLEDVLLGPNCRLATVGRRRRLRLLWPHWRGRSFVVKTHRAPEPWMRRLVERDQARVTYIYRDPRDAIVSALGRGERMRRKGKKHTFAQFTTVTDTLDAAEAWCRGWDAWRASGLALLVRYETLHADPIGTLSLVADHLGRPLPAARLAALVATYAGDGDKTQLVKRSHKGKAVVGRYRTVMSAEEQALCTARLGPYLEQMGYD